MLVEQEIYANESLTRYRINKYVKLTGDVKVLERWGKCTRNQNRGQQVQARSEIRKNTRNV